MVDGAKQLMKLTDADDFAMLSHLVAADSAAQQYQQQTDDNSMTETRFGTGFDVHKFSDEAGPICLGGIKLVSDRRILAHSDGDVGLHALCDAIFGALADGDIGSISRHPIRNGKMRTARYFWILPPNVFWHAAATF